MRLVKLHRAYEHMNRGDLAIENNDAEQALLEYGKAEAMFPDNLEMKFWHAVSLVNIERVDAALPLFKEIFAKDNHWELLVPRLPKIGLLPNNPDLMAQILSVSPSK